MPWDIAREESDGAGDVWDSERVFRERFCLANRHETLEGRVDVKWSSRKQTRNLFALTYPIRLCAGVSLKIPTAWFVLYPWSVALILNTVKKVYNSVPFSAEGIEYCSAYLNIGVDQSQHLRAGM